MTPLEKSILETIIYFDIFDYPLRVNEIHKWLWRQKASLGEVISTLENSEFLKEKLSSKDGFFFLTPPNSPPISPQAKQGGLGGVLPLILRGDERGLIEERLRKYRIAENKYKKAKKFIKLFSKFPFVRAIAICNDLGYSNSPAEGDIDLFVITAKNRNWSVRMKIAGFLKIFHLRPGETEKDALCPSFFVDEDNLNLKELAAVMPPSDDIHFVYWLNQMTPMFGRSDIWERFYEENKWTENSLPNIPHLNPPPLEKGEERRGILPPLFQGGGMEGVNPVRKIKPSIFQKIFEAILSGFVGDLVEKICKYIQLKFLPPQIKSMMNKNTNVVIRDGVLKLHTNDRRKEYFEKFQNKRMSLMGLLHSPRE